MQRIIVPTLLALGRHDEATPGTVQSFFDNIPNVRWEIFENSSHMSFVEEPERYFEVVGSFLAEHDESIERRVFGERTNGPLRTAITNLRWE